MGPDGRGLVGASALEVEDDVVMKEEIHDGIYGDGVEDEFLRQAEERRWTSRYADGRTPPKRKRKSFEKVRREVGVG